MTNEDRARIEAIERHIVVLSGIAQESYCQILALRGLLVQLRRNPKMTAEQMTRFLDEEVEKSAKLLETTIPESYQTADEEQRRTKRKK